MLNIFFSPTYNILLPLLLTTATSATTGITATTATATATVT